MISGFYTARSGLMAQQSAMDMAANNIANVNTVGFRAAKVSFADLIYQNLNREGAENPAMVGHGVKVDKTDLLMTSGGPKATDYALDYFIRDNEGFFAVETAAGNIEYTKAGNFILDNDGGSFYLAASNGDRVLDVDGGEIEVEFDENNNPVIDSSLIGVYRFPNFYGLSSVGGNRLVPTDISGEAELIEDAGLMNGYLEGSNAELSNEMVRVIEASKAFSFNSRIVMVADEIEQTINQLR